MKVDVGYKVQWKCRTGSILSGIVTQVVDKIVRVELDIDGKKYYRWLRIEDLTHSEEVK